MIEKEILDKYRKAGKIAREVREKAKGFLKVGMRLEEIAEYVEGEVERLGGRNAFPCNLSLNHSAAHYTPYSGDLLCVKDRDVLKVDFGVHIDGYIADTAFTLDFSGKYGDMKKAAEEALETAIKMAVPGTKTGDIGKAIEETINSFGFRPIANLSGHLLGRYDLHAGVSIPNIPKGEETLEEGQVFAIEPFATDGSGWVVDGRDNNIFRFLEYKPVRMQEAKKIMELADKKFSRLPFAKRWIKMPQLKLDMALIQLLQTNALYRYPVLNEKEGGIITQAEHTIIVADKPEVTT